MAQLTIPSFSINGNPINVFTSFTLSQSIFNHHHFTLVCPAEAIDGKDILFKNSKNALGNTFGARIESVPFGSGAAGKPLLFQGIVTGVETARFTGHHGDVIITGYSPTIILDAGPHCKSWLNRTLKNIVEDVLTEFPQNLLPNKIQPVDKEPFGFCTQYKESAWNFLQRITAMKGEWFFYDGRKLIISQPEGEKIDLVFGNNLSRFNVSLQTRPTNIKMTSWDFQNSQVYQSKPDGIKERAGLNPYGERTLDASQTVYNTQPKQWNPQYTLSKGQQDELTTLKSAMESAKMVQFQGESGHPGVAIGSMVSVSGSNVFTESTEGYGDYLITAVNHSVDAMGNYSNSFTAVPSSIKVPPISIPDNPVCETQSAIVTDNHDKQGLGRIRVKMHWMNGAEKTPWIRVTSPHGGGGKGHFFIPEIGEEVILGFEGDSATKPYVIGTVYHGQANNKFSNANNDIKTTQTRSGIKQVYNDADGSYFLSDKGGANMKFDGAGNAIANTNANNTVNAGTNNTVNAGNTNVINVGATKDAPPQSVLSMDASGNILIDGKTSITFKVGDNTIVINADGITATSSNGKVEVLALSGPIRIGANTDMNIESYGELSMAGGSLAKVAAEEVQINQS